MIVYIANGSVNRTTNGGLNVTGVSPTGVGFFACLARDFNNNQIIYAADGTDLWKSTNFGTSTATWDLSSAGLGSRALTTCPSNSSRLYGSNGTTTLRSDNATATAALITYSTISGNPGYPTLVNCTDIAVRPSNSLDIYASFGGYSAGKKVYFSTDGGANWSNVSGSLPNVACHSVVVDKNNAVYVGTDVGVFVRSTTMTDWQPFYNFLPKAPVSELIVNNTTDRIIACTFGRGNFYTDLYSTCPLNLTLTGVLSGNRFYNASDFIVSTNTVTQGVGNSAALSAGNYVRLDPGFEVKNSSTFIAYNNPCGTGGIPLRITNINETIPMETAYISAEEGKRFPNASITSITQQNDGAKIHVNTAGNYSLRITDKQGKVVKLVVLNKALGIGETIINWNRSEFQAGFYYVQLLKDNSMVHFQELDIRK